MLKLLQYTCIMQYIENTYRKGLNHIFIFIFLYF